MTSRTNTVRALPTFWVVCASARISICYFGFCISLCAMLMPMSLCGRAKAAPTAVGDSKIVRPSTLRSDLVSYRYMYPASAQGIKCYVML